jgi:hypothetical protein
MEDLGTRRNGEKRSSFRINIATVAFCYTPRDEETKTTEE